MASRATHIAQVGKIHRVLSDRISNPAAVEVRGASMVFGEGATKHVVFEDISFDVATGEIFCIVGASGCGKTTFLRQIAGLQTSHRRQPSIRGFTDRAPSRERAIVFQDYGRALLPWRTVRANILLGIEPKTMSCADAEAPAPASWR